MSDTILTEIVKTEQEAVRMDEDSRKQAREIVADAGRNAARILEESISKNEAIRAGILENAQREAQAEINSHEDQFNKVQEEFRREAGKNLSEAVELIFGRIVDLSGNN